MKHTTDDHTTHPTSANSIPGRNAAATSGRTDPMPVAMLESTTSASA